MAITASCLGLVIPLVLKWMVDGPVADHDPGGVWLGALYLLLLGLAEAALFGFRRWLVARPLAGVEAAMRADLYRHVQRLPVAFHDRWASGQLLSRGTTDLMLLRMFLAFPLMFLLVNGVTILAGFAILLLAAVEARSGAAGAGRAAGDAVLALRDPLLAGRARVRRTRSAT